MCVDPAYGGAWLALTLVLIGVTAYYVRGRRRARFWVGTVIWAAVLALIIVQVVRVVSGGAFFRFTN